MGAQAASENNRNCLYFQVISGAENYAAGAFRRLRCWGFWAAPFPPSLPRPGPRPAEGPPDRGPALRGPEGRLPVPANFPAGAAPLPLAPALLPFRSPPPPRRAEPPAEDKLFWLLNAAAAAAPDTVR
ncbi:MAG: hypothetical protein DCE88_15190 [Betaproteobacteria bacterium]|nr:MAG: hypothetical protein DCE88_15190 [Betaproteobacteria bacterium]